MASRSSLEYVSSVALVFPTLVAVVEDEERSRVLSALAIISKLAQVSWRARQYDACTPWVLYSLAASFGVMAAASACVYDSPEERSGVLPALLR